ncbi:hypothetical protein ACFTUC_17350 [Streptomyces sp. NPDC056944]|uniref:hypothetical protein n=1 Tax=Streptomyces sp. NPDC056944 TaxID=3345972 RepID=UPI003639F659
MTHLTTQQLVQDAAEARLRNSESTVFLDMLTARLHGNMPYSAARELAKSKVDEYLAGRQQSDGTDT